MPEIRQTRRSRHRSLTVGLIAFFVLVMLSQLAGCEGPTPRTAPVAQSEVTDGVVGDELPNGEEEVAEIDIPSPSGKLIDLATSSTVRVGGDGFNGSGVIVHKKDDAIYVLTVAHAVAAGVKRIELFSLASFPRSHTTLTQLEVLSTESRADLALIRAVIPAETDVTVAKLAELSTPEYAYSAGCVGSKPPKLLPEQILRAQELAIRLPGGLQKRFMWETRKGQQSGRSGGPLLDEKGALLGIALGKNGGNGYYSHIREISGYLIDNGLAALVTCAELLSIHQGNVVDR